MPKSRNEPDRVGLSATVQYIARAALFMAAAFFLLALAALLFMSPNEVSRGIYYVVLGLNALVIVGAVVLTRFMRRSDEKLARQRRAERTKPTIGEWLDKQDGDAPASPSKE